MRRSNANAKSPAFHQRCESAVGRNTPSPASAFTRYRPNSAQSVPARTTLSSSSGWWCIWRGGPSRCRGSATAVGDDVRLGDRREYKSGRSCGGNGRIGCLTSDSLRWRPSRVRIQYPLDLRARVLEVGACHAVLCSAKRRRNLCIQRLELGAKDCPNV